MEIFLSWSDDESAHIDCSRTYETLFFACGRITFRAMLLAKALVPFQCPKQILARIRQLMDLVVEQFNKIYPDLKYERKEP